MRVSTHLEKPQLRYETIDYGSDFSIHVRGLRDTMQFDGEDGAAEELGITSANWAIFGVLWPSGRTLAKMMFEHEIEGLRILEVGCGLGLTSLVLNQRNADVTATDYHPEAGNFLNASAALNGGDEIPFVRTSWDEDIGDLGRFDLIVGADLLYEPFLVESLATFIDNHAHPHCKIMIVDPNRGNRARLGKKMTLLGYNETRTCSSPELGDRTDVLNFSRPEA